MKKFNLLMCATLMANFLFSQSVSDFENLSLASDTFWDGSDLTGGFNSGDAHFVNDYTTSFFSWSGFTYSNKKDDTTAGYGNQYSAITASGWNNSANYAIANEYGNAKVILTGNSSGKTINGFYITNTTYSYLTMRDGDMFARKFGDTTGTGLNVSQGSVPDWFKVRALGWFNGALKANVADFYLADFRYANDSLDYLVKEWSWFDLTPLGNVDSIQFYLSSSDTGMFGMNNPAYFAMDQLVIDDRVYAKDDYITIKYDADTAINILSNDTLHTSVTILEIISPALIPGASASIDGNSRLLYHPSIGLIATDLVTYRVCDDAGFCDTADVHIQIIPLNSTDVDELALDNWSVYPNPFENDLSIIGYQLPVNESLFVVYDETGREITSGQIENSVLKLETHEWSSGIYFLKMNSADGISVKKIVKQ